jgi:uncharacterized protein YecT (DUF1311 family)
MKMLHTLRTAVCLAFAAGVAGCSKSNETPEVANVSQDTMLLRDLAEANKNTAAASAVDNSLTTIRTTGGGSTPETSTRPSGALPSPGGSQVLTSGPRMSPPLKANDGSRPTTVPTRLSPAGDPSSGNPCDSPAAADQRTCLNRSIVQNDGDLNRTYQELLAQSRKSGGLELEQRFRETQRNWVNQRDAACRDVGEGALWARARARCLASSSDARTAELRRSLNSLRGQGGP